MGIACMKCGKKVKFLSTESLGWVQVHCRRMEVLEGVRKHVSMVGEIDFVPMKSLIGHICSVCEITVSGKV